MSDTLPPFPEIDSTDWSPPAQTDPIEMVRITKPLVIYADADNANYQDNVWDEPRDSGWPRLNNWWDNSAPVPHQLVLRKYWKLVPGTFTHLYPGTHLQKSWAYEHGISTTDSESLTVQMGFSGGGVSAGVSATLSHSVTINDKQTSTIQFNVDPPASGTRVWLLWDLMYEFMIVRSGTDDVIPTGRYHGDVDFNNDDHYSGAYLDYRWTHLPISSGILCPQDKVFP